MNDDEILDEKDKIRLAFLDNLTAKGVQIEIVSYFLYSYV